MLLKLWPYKYIPNRGHRKLLGLLLCSTCAVSVQNILQKPLVLFRGVYSFISLNWRLHVQVFTVKLVVLNISTFIAALLYVYQKFSMF